MHTFEPFTRAQLSRRVVLKGAGALGVGAALAPLGGVQQAAAQTETIQDILNITATTEAFGVTVLGEALASAEAGNFSEPIPDLVIAILTAARAQEQFHLEFFQGLGGELLTDTFTVPPELLTDNATFFSTVVLQEAAEIAAQLAAFPTFIELGRPDLVKVSFQYAAEEAEHRVLANYALGTRPANDVAFAPVLFGSVAEFYDSLKERGIIGGSGTEIIYPGPGEIDASNVINTEPDGPEVSCGVTAMPNTGSGIGRSGNDGRGLAGVLGLTSIGAVTAALMLRKRVQADSQVEPPHTHA
jgi:hypothetical protein